MLRVVYVSSYTPRKCGIGTYTENLTKNIDALKELKPSAVVAVNDPGPLYKYSKKVVFQINQEDREGYQKAADKINRSNFNLVNVQHEFGLFGGIWGNYLVDFLKKLEKPCVTTMHTTLSPSSKGYQSMENMAVHDEVVREIGKNSSAISVMTKKAAAILQEDYKVDAEKINVIPHGCPTMPFIPSSQGKAKLSLQGRILLSNFGLLSRDKGINDIIMALPEIVKEWPEVLLVVIGQTHPRVKMSEGEVYRKHLKNLVATLNLEKNVTFQNRFLSQKSLIDYLHATDIYICAHLKKDQLSSGTITYALGAGRAIISTPFYYAMEVLAKGRGLLCKFSDPPSITENIKFLLRNPNERDSMEKRAYEYSRDITWPRVAAQYISLFEKVGR
jgi:glycosyltransferase involved in cell wall biosynthesis